MAANYARSKSPYSEPLGPAEIYSQATFDSDFAYRTRAVTLNAAGNVSFVRPDGTTIILKLPAGQHSIVCTRINTANTTLTADQISLLF